MRPYEPPTLKMFKVLLFEIFLYFFMESTVSSVAKAMAEKSWPMFLSFTSLAGLIIFNTMSFSQIMCILGLVMGSFSIFSPAKGEMTLLQWIIGFSIVITIVCILVFLLSAWINDLYDWWWYNKFTWTSFVGFRVPMSPQGQRPPGGRRAGTGSMPQNQQPVALIPLEMVPRVPMYRYPSPGRSMGDVHMPGVAGDMLRDASMSQLIPTALANASPEAQRTMLGENLYQLASNE